MTITVNFANGNSRTFTDAIEAQPRGLGVILFMKDGTQKAFDGPLLSISIDGREIAWPAD